MKRAIARACSLLGALLLAGAALQACSPSPEPPSETLIEAGDDPAVAESIKDAVRTLDVFWDKFDTRAAGADSFVVKLAMRAPDGYVEYVWADLIRHSDSEVVARLAVDPVHLKDLAFGSEVRVSPQLISDWGYEKGGKLYGHFTTRALISHMTPEQLAMVKDQLAPTPLELEDR